MPDILLLRLDAPLMSFGSVMVDQYNVTDRFPGLSLLAGLFGNALGYRHSDTEPLTRLQERIEFAARWDLPPEQLVDYHTVDLGQDKMREAGWTTRGVPEHRGGGQAAYGTHLRYRHYWANGVMTVAVTLLGEACPNNAELAVALREPARPLFLGRKTCLPAAPLLLDMVEAPNVLVALHTAPSAQRPGYIPPPRMEACWPARLGTSTEQFRQVTVYDRRDWRNQVHAGRRTRIEGLIEVSSP